MRPKYFQYISTSKVGMLFDQFRSQKFNLEVSPKIAIPGFEIDLGIKKQQPEKESLFSTTLKLISFLEKQNLVTPLTTSFDPFDTTTYYKDTGIWHTGIFEWAIATYDFNWGVKKDKDSYYKQTEAYVTIKIFDETIVILLGSPVNLIGEQEIREKKFTDGTYTIVEENLYNYIRASVEKDVYNADLDVTRPDDEWYEWYSLFLGFFCISTAKKLRKRKIETMFKIYSSYDLRKDVLSLAKISDHFLGRELLSDARDCGVLDFEKIYVGSPLYTALT